MSQLKMVKGMNIYTHPVSPSKFKVDILNHGRC